MIPHACKRLRRTARLGIIRRKIGRKIEKVRRQRAVRSPVAASQIIHGRRIVIYPDFPLAVKGNDIPLTAGEVSDIHRSTINAIGARTQWNRTTLGWCDKPTKRSDQQRNIGIGQQRLQVSTASGRWDGAWQGKSACRRALPVPLRTAEEKHLILLPPSPKPNSKLLFLSA